MKTRQLTLIGTVLALSALSIPFIISETAPKPEIPKTPNLELIDELVELGCTEPTIEHLLRSSNLLDDSFDGTVIRNFVGLPDGVSKKEYEQCFEFIHERRTKHFEKEPKSISPVMGKINPEKDIPVFFEIQLMKQGIKWELADRSWTNTDEGLVYPAKICSHIIKESGAELYIYTILEDEYSLSDMFMQREMPDSCAKFFPVAEVAKNEN